MKSTIIEERCVKVSSNIKYVARVEYPKVPAKDDHLDESGFKNLGVPKFVKLLSCGGMCPESQLSWR
uniref:Uncharacterized protein n=1 Tax=Daucus carota subsp. sativus TaxID=79200 RepID=A0A162A9C8_DAUCS